MSPLNIQGIANGYKVDDIIWRGAQPAPRSFALLKNAGCQFVIDLNNTGKALEGQKALAEASGLGFAGFEWSGILPPSLTQIHTAIEAIAAFASPGFIHCAHGSDRTGALCACWRIFHDKWTASQAISEAVTGLKLGGMHEVWFTEVIVRYAESLEA